MIGAEMSPKEKRKEKKAKPKHTCWGNQRKF